MVSTRDLNSRLVDEEDGTMKVFFGILIVLAVSGRCSSSQQNTDTFPFQSLLAENKEHQISSIIMSNHIPRDIVKVCVISQYNPPQIFYDEIPKDAIERSGLFPVDDGEYYIVYLNDKLGIESYDYIGIDRADFYWSSDDSYIEPLCMEPGRIKVAIRYRSGFPRPRLSLRME